MLTYKKSRYIQPGGYPIGVEFSLAGESIPRAYHDHEFSEIAIVLKGSGIHRLNSRSTPIKRGDCLLLHPGCLHCYDDCATLELVNIFFDRRMPLPMLENCGMPFISRMFPGHDAKEIDALDPVTTIGEEDFNAIIDLCRRLRYESRHNRPGKHLQVFAIFIELIIYLARVDSRICEQVNKYPESINCVVEFINKFYMQKIGTKQLLKIANMSERTMFRHFRQYFGVTPHEYLLHIRIQHAMEQLTLTQKSIYEIAFDHGFCDSNHFCHVFHKMLGQSPYEFRRLQQIENSY